MGDDLGDRVAGVVIHGFGTGVLSLSLSYSSMIVGVDSDVAVVLLLIGGGI